MFKNYQLKDLKYDIPVGIIIAFISIPISMGYAQVAGLPPVYGLYGSVLPVFLFGIMSTSKRFVFGVDAAPAALMGGLLFSMGIGMETVKAIEIVPVATVFVAGWLFLFAAINAGKFVKFISTPVMEGFITGISVEIIIMQIPKLFGGYPGNGEVLTLLWNIIEQAAKNFNLLSLILGLVTITVIVVMRKYFPKIPATVIMMFIGAILSYTMHLEKYGVKMLPAVEKGVPHILIPQFTALTSEEIIGLIVPTFSIALVIVSESLLASNNYAMKNGETMNNRQEILTYAVSNLASGFCGCCPVNGSVSRSGIANQFGVKSQVMSITASLTMVLILLFGTGFISYLPIPVLTGIVIAALSGILEFRLASKLKKVDKVEWFIFYVVFATVLFLGTLYGVLAGILLSFITVIIRASTPPVDFMGCIEGEKNFYSLKRVKKARPLKNTIIYQFNAPLFFANVGQVQTDLDKAIDENTKQIIIDGRGIGSIDVTATERLLLLYEKYKKKGIKFYLTEHSGTINDQLRTFGAEELFEEGAIKRSISVALRDCGIVFPYPLVEGEPVEEKPESKAISARDTADLEWAFGDNAEEKMAEMAEYLAQKIIDENEFSEETVKEAEISQLGVELTPVQENKFLDMLELELAILQEKRAMNKVCLLPDIEDKILEYHVSVGKALSDRTKEDLCKIIELREKNERKLKKSHPQAYKHFMKERAKYREKLKREHPEIAKKIEDAKGHIREEKPCRKAGNPFGRRK